MADQSPTPESLVAELLELKRRAEEATEAANSESAYAFNAKGNAEEHAKAIAQVRGTVEADFAWLSFGT
jgi:hypothetical protein